MRWPIPKNIEINCRSRNDRAEFRSTTEHQADAEGVQRPTRTSTLKRTYHDPTPSPTGSDGFKKRTCRDVYEIDFIDDSDGVSDNSSNSE